MTDNLIQKNRNVDIVFCIDGTGSMAPCIESVKHNAKNFYNQLSGALTASGTSIDSMRIKFIVFRDYLDDGDDAMKESTFFELLNPVDDEEFQKYLSDINAFGGGDDPENGLEALYYAMCSDFTDGPSDRQVIVLFSDADALDLKARASVAGYPQDMVDEAGLLMTWASLRQDAKFKLKQKNKRLVMFAPRGTKYEELSTKLDRSIFEPVDMSGGLGEIEFTDIIKMIVASVSNA